MENSIKVKGILDEDAPGFLVEYRGDFQGEIEKIDYAFGSVITKNLAIVAVPEEYKDRLRRDVPSITFIAPRSMYLLQDISPSNVGNINTIKVNPYLDLTGNGVIVGMVDSGIDYLNKEFIREDGTSKIISLWDQTIMMPQKEDVYIGKIYTNSEINEAINIQKDGGNPYELVPSMDEEYHGTRMASIIGARGYNSEVEGVAKDCDFLVVKLLPSPNYKKRMMENNIPLVPVYNNSEVLAAIEFLKREREILNRPMVIYIGVGTQEGSHDGNNITDRYITSLSSERGLVVVTGTGNTAADEGHVVGFMQNEGNIHTEELVIPREMKYFRFEIWVKKPNKMCLNITSPVGETSRFLGKGLEEKAERDFLLTNTKLTLQCYNPENYTGHQVFILNFYGIKSGIWKIELRGNYIVDGRYDIWLPNKRVMAEGTKFLQSSPYNTLTIPSTAVNVVTVAYFNSNTNSTVASCGKGYNTNGLINPDISTAGVNIITVAKGGEGTDVVSGSSAATAIVAGACALLSQWGIVNGNDPTMNSAKIRSLLNYGAQRDSAYEYPNEDYGYGKLDIAQVFKILGGNYIEYSGSRLYIRMPKTIGYIEEGIVGGK
ncbi:Subtilase family protein [Hathewaya proteolytica DSM 3090]|uniref:Subtilase family protein n=1 Tax=Hathewaya proteolytica DSM 3090 TaxID=1121331 RepID=A0A1M6SZX3_9CLOT|nr:S8 family peptidase [Hathewaya proteolytica]SHK50274.1 Subtilase family protein [Hathewaya proteolytica DSM 3090]